MLPFQSFSNCYRNTEHTYLKEQDVQYKLIVDNHNPDKHTQGYMLNKDFVVLSEVARQHPS